MSQRERRTPKGAPTEPRTSETAEKRSAAPHEPTLWLRHRLNALFGDWKSGAPLTACQHLEQGAGIITSLDWPTTMACAECVQFLPISGRCARCRAQYERLFELTMDGWLDQRLVSVDFELCVDCYLLEVPS